MEFLQKVDNIFAGLIDKYGLKVSGNERVRILANEHIEIRISAGRFGVEAPAVLRPHSSTGVVLDALVRERGGDPDTYLPDKNAPIPDLELYQAQKLDGYRRMIEEYCAAPLSGPCDWFTSRMDKAEYEKKLKAYVYANAPMGHPARKFRNPDWREAAENFLAEKGEEL